MNNQQYKDEIYLALIKLLMQNSASESNITVGDGNGNVIQVKKSQAEINREANRMVTCMKLDRLNAEELQLALDWWKNPTETNVLITDPFKYRIVMDFIKKYSNIITENDPCDTTDYSKEAAIQKLKESMSNGTPDVLPPNTGGKKPPPAPPQTPTKSKIPYIPIAIGLVVVLGVIIYIKKAK